MSSPVPSVSNDDVDVHVHIVVDDDSIAVSSPPASAAASVVLLSNLPPSLPTTATTTTGEHDDDEDTNRRMALDEVSSYTSVTSATTVHSLVDEATDHSHPRNEDVRTTATPPSSGRIRTRPRSTSLHNVANIANIVAGASRPRSNPRTRTPLRRESPLLILGRRVDDPPGGSSPSRNRGVRFGVGVDDAALHVEDRATAREPTGTTATARAGHWLSRAATASNADASSRRRLPSSSSSRRGRPARSRHSEDVPARSAKQRPSHRKVRRWNNDRFVGVGAGAMQELYQFDRGDGDENDERWHSYWKEHCMPNYPLRYRSEFAKLAGDDSAAGRMARERFVKGEVGSSRPVASQRRLLTMTVAMTTHLSNPSNQHHDDYNDDDDNDDEENMLTAEERERLWISFVENELIAKLRKLGVADAPS
ncbi:hypothetical protein ACHAXS_003528, partial [Conticribra weissflogii]